MTAISDIAAERAKQLTQWTPEHDDRHLVGQLAMAAACYAMHDVTITEPGLMYRIGKLIHDLWPWACEWWKPKDRRSNLVTAGALIVAEIERIDRLKAA